MFIWLLLLPTSVFSVSANKVPLCSFRHWIPGCHGPFATALIKDLSFRGSRETGENRFGSFLVQRLSIAIQRGNASSVLGTIPSRTWLLFIIFFFTPQCILVFSCLNEKKKCFRLIQFSHWYVTFPHIFLLPSFTWLQRLLLKILAGAFNVHVGSIGGANTIDGKN